MFRGVGIAGFILLFAGCVAPQQEHLRAYNDDGLQLFARGDYGHARESFQAALKLKPDDIGVQYNIARCYDLMGNATQAEQTYYQCLVHEPNHAPSRQALAILLVRQNRVPDATRLVEEWLSRQPRSAEALAVDGWLWHQIGDLPRAQARLQQALDIDPHNNLALLELGSVFEAMQRPERALVLYQRSLAKQPQQPEINQRVQFLLAKGAKAPQPE